jgi:hypothetical protein
MIKFPCNNASIDPIRVIEKEGRRTSRRQVYREALQGTDRHPQDDSGTPSRMGGEPSDAKIDGKILKKG